MWIIFFLVVLIGLFCTINNRSNKYVNCLLVLLLALLIAAPRNGYDTESFQILFEKYADNRMPLDPGYNKALAPFICLMRFFYTLGMHNLYIFKFVTMFMLLLLVEIRSEKVTSNFAMWVFYYACSIFVLDAIQFRNHIALCLFIIAFSYLVEAGRKNDIIFCVFMLLASIMHITFGVYFILLLAKYADNKIDRYAKKFMIICMGIIGVCYFVRPILNMLTAIPRYFMSDYYSHFFQEQSRLGYIILIAVYIPIILLLFYIGDKYKTVTYGTVDFSRKRMEHSIIRNGFIMLFPVMILCLYSVSIERFLRNLIVICLFSFCNYIQDCKNYLERRNVKIFLFMICVYIFVYQNYLTGPASDIVEAVLKGEFFFIN